MVMTRRRQKAEGNAGERNDECITEQTHRHGGSCRPRTDARRSGRHRAGNFPGDQPDHHDQAVHGTSLANFDPWLVDHHDTDPEKVFTVVDQIDGAPAIRISGKDWGGLLTKQGYRDYRLIAEFRWGGVTWGNRKTRTRDSGVLLHARGRMGNTGRISTVRG